MTEKEIRVSFCPQCKSTNVKYSFGLKNLFGVVPRMRCSKCGFSSAIFPILVTTESKLKASVKKTKKKAAKKKVGGKKK